MRIKLEISVLRLCSAVAITAVSVVTPCAVLAQQPGSQGLGQLQAGYAGSRYSTATSASGSTRDSNGNRLIVDGIIQSGASSYHQSSSGVSSSSATTGRSSQGGSAIGGATAIGNNLNVVVQGNHNTVIVKSNQTNTGNISAGTVLNGTLVFP